MAAAKEKGGRAATLAGHEAVGPPPGGERPFWRPSGNRSESAEADLQRPATAARQREGSERGKMCCNERKLELRAIKCLNRNEGSLFAFSDCNLIPAHYLFGMKYDGDTVLITEHANG